MDGQIDHQDSLYSLLREVQLEHFYFAIKAIDVTKVEHFENVVFQDLTNPKVGMGAPAARRLLEAARKRNNNKWKKNLLNIILPNKVKDKDGGERSTAPADQQYENEPMYDTTGLTCLIAEKDIKLLDKIGDGSFGVVMRAQWTQSGTRATKSVAVKILKQEALLRAIEDFVKEVSAMHHLRHPNLIRLYGIVLSSPLMMVTELAEQGSLRTKLAKTLGAISLSSLTSYSIQIANGMDYLESKRLIHRDLATRNIFITGTNTIKIGDFGLMRTIGENEDYYTMSDNMKIPFPWCALESLKFRQFSHASDTWMFGVTLWEIFSFGQEPWSGLNGQQIVKRLEQNERLPMPKACAAQIYEAIQLCWDVDPMQRPTFSALIKFFRHSQPIRLRASLDFDSGLAKYSNFISENVGTDFLKITAGDEIEVIDGQPENYWWRGQSQRTWNIGIFPRSISKDRALIDHKNISKPLKNSFIHTGHMDVLGKKSWGNPEFIEKMYLEHPVEPHDVVGHTSSAKPLELETRGGRKSNKKPNQVDKIMSLDELTERDDFDQAMKEDILIDLSDSHIPDSNKAQEIMQSELASINFKSTSTPPPPPPLPQQSPQTDLFTELPSQAKEVADKSKVKESILTNFSRSYDGLKLDSYVCEVFASETPKDVQVEEQTQPIFSKHYAPPLDSVAIEDVLGGGQSSIKPSRYYSSVASNFDAVSSVSRNFCTNPYGLPSSASQCQCCEDDSEEYSNHLITNMPCPPFPCPDSSFYGSSFPLPTYNPNGTLTFPPPPPPPPPPALAMPEIPKAVAYQTKICQDFIQELEANLGKVRGEEENGETENGGARHTNGNGHSFPIINPPPKSSKVRRPAPPPPIKKCIN